MCKNYPFILFLIAIVFSSSSLGRNVVISDFEGGSDGWTTVDNNNETIVYSGGAIHSKEGKSHDTWYWAAPPKFLGNQSAAFGGSLAFDLQQSETDNQYSEKDVILLGGGLELSINVGNNPGSNWTHYEVELSEKGGWHNDKSSRPATTDEISIVLRSLQALYIRGEFRIGEDSSSLDNVALRSHASEARSKDEDMPTQRAEAVMTADTKDTSCAAPQSGPEWLVGAWSFGLVPDRGDSVGGRLYVGDEGTLLLDIESGERLEGTLSTSADGIIEFCLNDDPTGRGTGPLTAEISNSLGTESISSRYSFGGAVAGEQPERHAGSVVLVRWRPIIVSAEAVDLPPLTLLKFAATGSVRAISLVRDAYGEDVMAVTWLRLRGLDLPTEEGREFSVKFDDPDLFWTGEYRVPYQYSSDMPEVLDIRVAIRDRVDAGVKRFVVNGGEATWDFGSEFFNLRFREERADWGTFDPTDRLIAGNRFIIEAEMERNAPGTPRLTLDVPGVGQMIVALNRIEDQQMTPGYDLYRSSPIPLLASQIDTGSEDSLLVSTVSEDNGVSAPITRIPITAPGDGIWPIALARVAACRAEGAQTSIRNLIVTNGEIREIAITEDDHAAAIVLRDELILTIGEWIDREQLDLEGNRPGDPITETHRRAAMLLIREIRREPFARTLFESLVAEPNGEIIPLNVALGPRMEERTFAADVPAFTDYAVKAIREARSTNMNTLVRWVGQMRAADLCKIEELFSFLRPGIGVIGRKASDRLVRPAYSNEGPWPAWRPNLASRAAVTSFSTFIAAADAQMEWSETDTGAVLAAAAVVSGGAGTVLARSIATGGRIAAVLGRAAVPIGRGLGFVSAGAEVAGYGQTILVGAEYLEAVEAVEREEELSPILGESRLAAAKTRKQQRFTDLAIAVGSDVGLRAIGAILRYARPRPAPRASLSVLDDAEFREAIIEIDATAVLKAAEEAIPSGRFVGGSVDELADQLERVGIPRDEAADLLRRLELQNLAPDVAASRILMRRGVDPVQVMRRLNISEDELGRLLDREMLAEGISDPIQRAQMIREYMGPDLTPAELYYVAEMEVQLPDAWWARPGGNRGRRTTLHSRQLSENERMLELQGYGMSRAQAQQGARTLTEPGMEGLDSLSYAVGYLDPNVIARNGIDPDVVARAVDVQAVRNGLTDPAERTRYVAAMYGDGPLPPSVELRQTLVDNLERHPELGSLRLLDDSQLALFLNGKPSQRQSTLKAVQAVSRLMNDSNAGPASASIEIVITRTAGTAYLPNGAVREMTVLEKVVYSFYYNGRINSVTEAEIAAATRVSIDEVREAIEVIAQQQNR